MRFHINILTKFILLVSIFLSEYLQADDKHFVVLTTSYNNQAWYKKNLESVFGQKYPHWRLIYVNDCSKDCTGSLVEHFIAHRAQEISRQIVFNGLAEQIEFEYIDKQSNKHLISLINNKKRRLALVNQYDVLHICDPNEVVAICDGDDWLAHNNVLRFVNNVYQNDDVWITWGQFKYWQKGTNGCSGAIPLKFLRNREYRYCPLWVTSHLRTFYAGLFQQIKLEDFKYQGEFFLMCTDFVTMIPMIEMACTRVQFIPEILYIYNDINPLSLYRNHNKLQRDLEMQVRYKPRYERLNKRPK